MADIQKQNEAGDLVPYDAGTANQQRQLPDEDYIDAEYTVKTDNPSSSDADVQQKADAFRKMYDQVMGGNKTDKATKRAETHAYNQGQLFARLYRLLDKAEKNKLIEQSMNKIFVQMEQFVYASSQFRRNSWDARTGERPQDPMNVFSAESLKRMQHLLSYLQDEKPMQYQSALAFIAERLTDMDEAAQQAEQMTEETAESAEGDNDNNDDQDSEATEADETKVDARPKGLKDFFVFNLKRLRPDGTVAEKSDEKEQKSEDSAKTDDDSGVTSEDPVHKSVVKQEEEAETSEAVPEEKVDSKPQSKSSKPSVSVWPMLSGRGKWYNPITYPGRTVRAGKYALWDVPVKGKGSPLLLVNLPSKLLQSSVKTTKKTFEGRKRNIAMGALAGSVVPVTGTALGALAGAFWPKRKKNDATK